MVEVTCQNFKENLSKIEASLAEASFICVDFEFTGLHTNRCPEISLFDTPQERYTILRESCKDFTVLQCGLSVFSYDKVARVYGCDTYTFSLFPRPFRTLKRQTQFEASACEFLIKHDFDFNRCFYGGIPYLNEVEISQVETSSPSNYTDEIVVNNVKLAFLNRKMLAIEKWRDESVHGEVDKIDCFSSGVAQILCDNVINQFDDIIAELPPNENSILHLQKSAKEGKQKYLKDLEIKEEAELNDAIGFTHVFRLFRKHRKPLIGHNLLMDIMFMYEKFYAPLPDSYEEFKSTVFKEFPVIYDTRHIVSNVKFELRSDSNYKDYFRGISLLALYEECQEKHIRGILYQPTIQSNFCGGTGMKEHDAGYDSYLTGQVFVRLAHFCAHKNSNSPVVKPFHFQDYLREFSKYKHCLNLIRCSLTHINLSRKDPQFQRPQWLVVTARDSSLTIVEEHVACVFSAFGTVSVRKLSEGKCLVAMPSINMAAGLLVEMQNHKSFIVKRYEPPSYYILPSTVFVTAFAVCCGAFFIYKRAR